MTPITHQHATNVFGKPYRCWLMHDLHICQILASILWVMDLNPSVHHSVYFDKMKSSFSVGHFLNDVCNCVKKYTNTTIYIVFSIESSIMVSCYEILFKNLFSKIWRRSEKVTNIRSGYIGITYLCISITASECKIYTIYVLVKQCNLYLHVRLR